MKQNNYRRGVGELSKTGRTIIKMTKGGRKYYYNIETYQKRKQRLNEQRKKEGLPLIGKDDVTRSLPYRADKENEAYGRYYEKKSEIRAQYPKWVHMSREEWREYYAKVLHLIYNDVDYLQYKNETKTFAEREDDEWWENKKRKDEEYNGHNDEYDWK